jgi:general L-amino acid transport system permease protein
MSPRTDDENQSRVPLWNDPKVRAIAVQSVLVAVLVLLGYAMASNILANLQSRNIASGFSFLAKSAGFDIIQSLIPYTSNSSYGRALAVGLVNTLVLSVLSIAAATLIGFVVGVMRLSGNWLVARVASLYIEIFRNVPLLLWIFVWYSAVLTPLPGPKQAIAVADSFFLSNRGLMMPKPIFGEGAWLAGLTLAAGLVAAILVNRWAGARKAATGVEFPSAWVALALLAGLPLVALAVAGFPVTFEYPALEGFNFAGGLTVIPEFIAMFLALSIYSATFIAEAVRAGIMAVSRGQTEAAHALGLRPGRTLQLVVIPQALRVIIPPVANTYLSLTKNSSLAVAIGYPDLVATGGTVLNQTGQAIEIVGIWMLVYLGLSLGTSFLMNLFNSRMKLAER